MSPFSFLNRIVTHYRELGREEIANSLTHGIGLILALVGLSTLVVFASLYGNAWHVVSTSIYGATLVLLYAASTLYHSVRRVRLKYFLKIVDHSSIYLLIAGSYTPFTLVHMRGEWGWSLFLSVWALAILGIGFKVFFVNRFEIFSTIVYLLMGWSILIAIKPALDTIPSGGLVLLLLGGLAYSGGVIFFILENRFPFGHAVWHLFVLAGSILHYFSVMFYVIPTIS